ncbi:sensor histidine kinase [Streptomyces sp. WAC06614]|uniref:sensor histidine kinase n=1 Tax=Streptomyces sp. WAC06614 TaxID=2487416 RepID=UPI000F7791F6|nr:histidine kinase [Streptomyces sp. WAC06614]RSS64836.1 sensor histidine kinase [Streptomyces sp. WAC06614]
MRYLPHALVLAAAALVLLTGGKELAIYYRVDAAAPIAAAYAAALALALYVPGPAWLFSLTVCAVTSFLLHLTQWPWPALYAHAGVLFLLSLRVRARTASVALALSVALTLALPLAGPGVPAVSDFSYGYSSAGLFVVVVVTGVLLRSRREAHSEALRQAAATAEERARRTVLEERGRIARELHDVVAHHMSVVSIQAQVASRVLEDPPPALLDSLSAIRAGTVEALGELRHVLALLRAEDSDDDTPYTPQPTLAQLGQLTDTVRATGTTVTTETTGTPRPLTSGVELSAYRIVQEALSNALRHSPGAAVHVHLAYASDRLTVEVTNTAPGRATRPVPGAGHGLLGMRERTTMLGGRLAAHPTEDGGYAVTATLPAEAAAAPTATATAPPDPYPHPHPHPHPHQK